MNGITSISAYTFGLCESLITVSIPNSVNEIGAYAFYGCKNLANIDIPANVEFIGASAFEDCKALKSITLPDNINAILSGTFKECNNIKEITLPYYVASVGENAFYNVPLEVINIGTKLKTLENLPIHIQTLKEINVSPDNNYFSSENGVLYNKKKTSLIRLPMAMNISELNIPNSVVNIGESAFANNKYIRNIYLSEKCSSVEPNAFRNCNHLDKLFFYNKNCEIYMSKDTIYENTLINGYTNSTAEQYASTYNRAFKEITVSTVTCLLREQKGREKVYPALISKLNGIFSNMEKIFDELPDQDVKVTSDIADNTPPAELKSSSIQFYASIPLKDYIDKKADSLGMDTAQFLRISALAEQPVYVLEKGHYIARYLLELYDLATGALLDSKVDNKYGQVIQRKIQDILDLFVEISKRLTNVNNIEGAAEEED